VLVHQFDDTDAAGEPWLPCPQTCWGERCWCADLGDRISTTLILASIPAATNGRRSQLPLFSPDAPGFIVNPQRASILCSYASDAGTAHKTCAPPFEEGCVPGCVSRPSYDDHGNPIHNWPGWCGEEGHDSHHGDQCPMRPDQLAQMVEQITTGHYNEVVVDADSFVKSLPWSVEAFFFPVGGHATKAAAGAKARETRTKFLQHYQLTARDVPILRLDVTDLHEPFSDDD